MNPATTARLRPLLVLGRVANLPTVWSDCLAGWWLGGGGNGWKLPLLLLGMSAIHTGGMFLNDAFDADSDRQRRPERPIPSRTISPETVWHLGFGQLGFGIFLLIFCGKMAVTAAFFLALFVLLFNFTHQFFTASPWLMGICRFWVYIIAGATGVQGVNGWVIFCGAALAFYVAGMGYIARRERSRRPISFWPLLLLAAPVLLALAMNTGSYRLRAIWVSVVLGIWIVRCARTLFAGGSNIGLIVLNLAAGIVFVDWLAVAPDCSRWLGVILLALFGLTAWLQRFVPRA
jgi:4-hydroxybenzoate polyprenyltransferase